jgi:P27 family predicted phage terminase small subunit
VTDEPETIRIPEPDVPECPAELEGPARQEWDRLAPLLTAGGTISGLDRAVLAVYCSAYARFMECEVKARATGGLVVKQPSGFPGGNPYLTVQNAAAKQMATAWKELGLSPRSRKGLATKRKAKSSAGGIHAIFGGGKHA